MCTDCVAMPNICDREIVPQSRFHMQLYCVLIRNVYKMGESIFFNAFEHQNMSIMMCMERRRRRLHMVIV